MIEFYLNDNAIEFFLNAETPAGPPPENDYRLTEDGDRRITEDGNPRILE